MQDAAAVPNAQRPELALDPRRILACAIRTSISASASAAITFVRVPPRITPALTVSPRSSSVNRRTFSSCHASRDRAVPRVQNPLPHAPPRPSRAACSRPHPYAPFCMRHPAPAPAPAQKPPRQSRASFSVIGLETVLPTSSSLFSKKTTGRRSASCLRQMLHSRQPHRHARLHIQHSRVPTRAPLPSGKACSPVFPSAKPYPDVPAASPGSFFRPDLPPGPNHNSSTSPNIRCRCRRTVRRAPPPSPQPHPRSDPRPSYRRSATRFRPSCVSDSSNCAPAALSHFAADIAA